MSSKYQGRQWIAFDGEAIDGKYVQLVDSLGKIVVNPEGISTADCLRFVSRGLPKSASWRRCLFGQKLDVQHWIVDLPRDDRIKFLAGEMVTYTAGDEGWSLQWIAQRIFSITPHHIKAQTIKLWDTYYWCGKSFLDACAEWSIVVPPIVDEGKAAREDLSGWTAERLAEYSITECQLLVELMTKIEAAVGELPFNPQLKNWHGPGALASHYMRKIKVRKQMRDFSGSHIGLEIFDAFARAYHGGRIEDRIAGTIGPVYRYDIRSAYGWGMSHLGPVGYQWIHEMKFSGEPWAKMSVWRVTWEVPDSAPVGPFPWRSGMTAGRYSISYPRVGEGWYWWPEVKAALTVWGHRNIKVHEGYWALGGDKPTRIGKLANFLYNHRLRWAGSPHEDILKRVLQTTYGKTAQRRSQDGWPGFWYCLPWAGWATSCVRAALLMAVKNDMDAVVAFTTDGIITTRELPVKLGIPMGGWRVERFESGTFLQAGLYRVERADRTATVEKTQGFERADIVWEKMLDDLNTGKPASVVVRRFIGHGLADHWPEKFGAHRLQFKTFRLPVNPYRQSQKRAGARALLGADGFNWRTDHAVLGILPGDDARRVSAPCRLPAAWQARAEKWTWEDLDAEQVARVDRRTEGYEWQETLEDWLAYLEKGE